MIFVVAGVSHHQTPEAIRQQYVLRPDHIENFLKTLNRQKYSLIILLTCNRLEIYTENLPDHEVRLLWAGLLKFCGCTHLEPTYVLKGRQAIEHTFKVALGLDSRVLREHHILGQMRKAFHQSYQQNFLCYGMRKLFERCFHLSKNIRSSWQKSSLGLLAVKYLTSIAKGRPIFILGAGDIIKDFLKNSEPLRGSQLILCNRTYENALSAAKRSPIPIQVLPFEEGLRQIPSSPILVLGLSTTEPLLNVSDFENEACHYDIIDFGMPSCLGSLVKNQKNITLKSLDSFHNTPLDKAEEMDLEIEIQQNITSFEEDLVLYQKRHLIVKYRENLEKACEDLKNQALHSYERGEDPVLLIEKLAYKIQQKLLHQPSIAFKESMLESHHLDFFYHSTDAIALPPVKSFESV